MFVKLIKICEQIRVENGVIKHKMDGYRALVYTVACNVPKSANEEGFVQKQIPNTIINHFV